MESMAAQTIELPYYEIPAPSKVFTPGTVASRTIDGLGFRYYWATEGLVEKDLNFKPTDESRSAVETLHHIYELSEIIVNATLKKVNKGVEEDLSFKEEREKTLLNLKKASDILKDSEDVSEFVIKFKTKELPFWNVLNGPLADAIWHVGQIVSFRRSSGNPFPKGVSVLMGTKQ